MKKSVMKFTLGDLLRERGISQTRAAQLTGLSRQSISILAGEPVQVQIPTIEKLCKGLGISPADLFKVDKAGQ